MDWEAGEIVEREVDDQAKHPYQNELSYYEQGWGSIPVIPYMEPIDLHAQPEGRG